MTFACCPKPIALLAALGLLCVACSQESLGAGEEELREIPPTENSTRDILATELEIDLAAHKGTARITVDRSTRRGASFEAGGLEIDAVAGPAGEPLQFRLVDGRLDVGLPAHQSVELSVAYRYHERSKPEGAMTAGVTFTWPYFCGNLFPCQSDPADGLGFSLALSHVPDGSNAVYPADIPADAPSYMLAWAVGDYTRKTLGTTSAGTTVSVYYLPGEQTAATKGTAHLVPVFDWLEKTYGAYLFGSDVGSVSAPWGGGAAGGMEHHPYWHVASDAMGDVETHAHEAAHGWFGNGVRIGCWEDLTLSEGTTTYLTARAIEAVSGAQAGADLWADYEQRLDNVIASEDRKAWPDTCNQIDVLTDLWNDVVYVKGAFFLRAVEAAVGREALDRALARFYQQHQTQAAHVQDLLDAIAKDTGFDPSTLAQGWLRSLGRPDE